MYFFRIHNLFWEYFKQHSTDLNVFRLAWFDFNKTVMNVQVFLWIRIWIEFVVIDAATYLVVYDKAC